MAMVDRLCRGLVPASGLRAVAVRIGDTARMARMLHGLGPTSARLFAEALAAGTLLGALQKGGGRINLQVECDGRVRGLLVDADFDANVRGYVREPRLAFPGDPADAARAALGRSGTLSVIRDNGAGQHYRSAVELSGEGLVAVLRRWFAASEQVETALDLVVAPRGEEPLGDVVGLLVQRLPDGDAAAVERLRAALAGGALARAVERGGTVQELIRMVVGEGFELLADGEVAYRCGCSQARARAAVSVLGADGVADLLAREGKAVIDCEFCHQHFEVAGPELEEIVRRLRAGDAA